jgi:hypothetical protein
VNNKSLSNAFLTTIMISGLILASGMCFVTVRASTDVSGIPKPSVPDFTLKVVAHPYDVPPKYETNPYTGKSEMTEAGYHVENKSIEVTIRNQPFTSTSDENGNYANLYYAVRFKGSYVDKWKYYPHDMDSNYSTATSTPFNASESEYTTITVGLSTYLLNNVPAGGEVDFQVEAFIGYEKRVDFFFLGDEGHYYYTFTAFERSGWSETQTITIPEGQTSTLSSAMTTPTPNQEPQQAEQVEISIDVSIGVAEIDPDTYVVIAVAVVGAGLGLLIYLIKRNSIRMFARTLFI